MAKPLVSPIKKSYTTSVYYATHSVVLDHILSLRKLITRMRLSLVSLTHIIMETSSFAVYQKSTNIITLLNKTNSDEHITGTSRDVINSINK